eukprot:scaffold218430_cov20-Tisochrysis_lutea.AAC.2
MALADTLGPLSALRSWQQARCRVRVDTRHASGRRGSAVGFSSGERHKSGTFACVSASRGAALSLCQWAAVFEACNLLCSLLALQPAADVAPFMKNRCI